MKKTFSKIEIVEPEKNVALKNYKVEYSVMGANGPNRYIESISAINGCQAVLSVIAKAKKKYGDKLLGTNEVFLRVEVEKRDTQ